MPTVSVALTIIAYDPTVARCRQLSRGQQGSTRPASTIPATAVFLAFDGLSAPIWGVGPSVPYVRLASLRTPQLLQLLPGRSVTVAAKR